MKFSIKFAWYDLWIGAFWHRHDRILYICPLPCFVLKFDFGGCPSNPAGGQYCTHTVGKATHGGGAMCAGCGDWLGWFCSPSPLKRCEYDHAADPAHDHCLHCGEPEERK